MRALAIWAVLAVSMAVGTATLGWWTVPVLAAVGGALRSQGRPALEAAVTGAVAWLGLLALTASRGPVDGVAERVGGVFGLPAPALYVLTLLFPALLAGAAAGLAALLVAAVGKGNGDAGETGTLPPT